MTKICISFFPPMLVKATPKTTDQPMAPKKMARTQTPTETPTETPIAMDNLELAQAQNAQAVVDAQNNPPTPEESPVDTAPPAPADPNFPQFSNELKDLGDGKSIVRAKAFSVQLGKSGNDRMRSEWGLSQFGDKKKAIELEVTPAVEAKINEMDDHAERTFNAKARTWFKKDKRLQHLRLIKTKEDGTRVVKVKVVCEGDKPTEIYSFADKNSRPVADSIEARQTRQ